MSSQNRQKNRNDFFGNWQKILLDDDDDNAVVIALWQKNLVIAIWYRCTVSGHVGEGQMPQTIESVSRYAIYAKDKCVRVLVSTIEKQTKQNVNY